MPRKFVIIMLCAMMLCLTACNAEELNNTIESVAAGAGVEMDINITQDQIDDATAAGKEAADKVESIIKDEDVQNAAKDFMNSLKDAAGK